MFAFIRSKSFPYLADPSPPLPLGRRRSLAAALGEFSFTSFARSNAGQRNGGLEEAIMQASQPPVDFTPIGKHDPSQVLESVDDLTRLVGRELAAEGEASREALYPDESQIGREVERLRDVRLSAELQKWVQAYQDVGDRHPYLWAWCRRGVEITTLSSVEPEVYDEVCDTKVLSVMYDVLLDDVADQGKDKRFLEYLIQIQSDSGQVEWSGASAAQRRYAQFTVEVWREIDRRLRRFARFDEFQDLLEFDYLQLFNAMRYSHLMNQIPSMLNMAEHDLYLPHNMHMMASSTFDLMCSPEFDIRELGHLREAIWHAQYMGRIGNLITTWQREWKEKDFSSGVFVNAVSQGDVTVDELLLGDQEEVIRRLQSAKHEEFFMRRWHSHRRLLKAKAPFVKSVDLNRLVEGLERLICLHLGSRGQK